MKTIKSTIKATNTTKTTAIKVAAGIKAGGLRLSNHSRSARVIRVASGLRGGAAIYLKNHNARLR
jgi:hypothetical protein